MRCNALSAFRFSRTNLLNSPGQDSQLAHYTGFETRLSLGMPAMNRFLQDWNLLLCPVFAAGHEPSAVDSDALPSSSPREGDGGPRAPISREWDIL